jgi:hypothetical protein
MRLRSTWSQLCVWSLIFVISVGVLPAFGQENGDKDKKDKQQQKKKKSESSEKVYQRWMDEDVRWIITDEERKAFKTLKTDDERETFIEQFWARRDPDPDTPENEYKEEYAARIAYANQHFASGIPGWKTDRGRIYIVFGPPDSKETHPAGGQYQRPTNEGGGSTSTFPFEIWFYRHLDNVGDGLEIEFVDPTMSGEYHIARSPDEKDALLTVPGAGLTLSEELGLSDKTNRVAFGGMGSTYVDPLFGQRSQDSEFERLRLYTDLQRPPSVTKMPGFGGAVDPVLVETEVLPVTMRTDYLRVGDDSVVTSFSLLLDHQDLALENKGGIYQGEVNINARITSVAGKRSGNFTDTIKTDRFTDRDVAIGQQMKSIYQKNYILPPGRYKIDLVAQDTNSGKMGIIHQSFVVPQYKQNELGTSSVIVASDISRMTGVAAGQFVIGRYKVHPNMTQTFKPGTPIGVFLQVYNAQIDQYTLMPNVEVNYVVTRNGQEIARVPEDGKTGVKDVDGQRLVLARMLALKLDPGTYQVMVSVTDKVSQKTINTTPSQFIVKQ